MGGNNYRTVPPVASKALIFLCVLVYAWRSQGPPFRGGDDPPHRIAPAPGRDHRLHELDRSRDGNRVRRHDLQLWPGVRPFTLLNGNILTMVFLLTYGHLRHSNMWIPFTGIAGRILHSPGPSPVASLHQSRSFRQELRLCACPLGLGVRHARNSCQDARAHRVWRRRRGGAVPVNAFRPCRAVCALRRPCAEAGPKNRRRARRRERRPNAALTAGSP